MFVSLFYDGLLIIRAIAVSSFHTYFIVMEQNCSEFVVRLAYCEQSCLTISTGEKGV